MTRSFSLLLFSFFFSVSGLFSQNEWDGVMVKKESSSQPYIYLDVNPGQELVTTYTLASNNKKIAQQTWSRIDESYLGNYSFQNYVTGKQEEIKRKGDELVIRFKTSKNEEWEEGTIPYNKNTAYGEGISIFIKDNWNDLLKGEMKVVCIIALSRLACYDFEIQLKNQTDQAAFFTMEASNFLLRQFAPTFTFGFNKKTKELFMMDGLSHVSIENEFEEIVLTYGKRKP